MGNLDSLPVEIILKILKGFDIDSVIQYRLVSRTWKYPVYHRLLDYLRETQAESEQKLKETKSHLRKSVYFKKLKNIIGFVKRGIIDAQRNSGGPNPLFESGKLLHFKKITDADLKRYLNLLNRKETVGSKGAMLKRLRQRRQYILQDLRERLRFPY